MRAFAACLNGVEVTKEAAIAYKNKLLYENYAARSVNSMIASLNSLFVNANIKVSHLAGFRS